MGIASINDSNGPHGLNLHNYAYFLFNQQRFEDAAHYFIESMKVFDARWHFLSCLGYARTLEALHRYQEADKYYQQAMECPYDKGRLQYHYGVYLFNQQR